MHFVRVCVPLTVLEMLLLSELCLCVSQHDVSSMRFLSAGGAPTPPSMVGQVSKQFKNASPGQVRALYYAPLQLLIASCL